MNKKRLSVVMAGAMLASAVAPVMAATQETVVNNSEKGLLIKRLRELMLGTRFSNVKVNEESKTDVATNHVDNINESVYYVKVGNEIYWINKIEDLEKAIQDASAGTKVEVYDRGHVEKDGVVYNHALENVRIPETYTKAELENIAKDFSKKPADREGVYSDVIYKMEYKDGSLYVTVRKAADDSKHVVKVFKEGDNEVEFSKPMNAQNIQLSERPDDWVNFDHFKEWEHVNVQKGKNLPEKLIETITITDVDASFKTTLPELYDGLFLTENGQKLFDTLKEYDSKGFTVSGETVSNIVSDGRGIYELNITLTKTVNKKTIKQVVTVTSKDKEQLKLFANGISVVYTTSHGKKVRKFPVQKLAGDNRYETAVKVAKENADINTVSQNGNIVLVNGNALVDGLAAAPLAASVSNMGNTNGNTTETQPLAGHFVAPILLTEANGLPKATKDYMKEIIAHQQVGALDKVTVYLVGGEAVISPAVENELKEIGFRVVRAGGKDREATSLKVAKLMRDDTTAGDGYDNDDTKEAFLVGADGEADAMSIAAYAASQKAPIIVESRHGLSDESVEFLKGYKNAGTGLPTTIIGGEAVVSKATEEKLIEEKITVDRIHGANRQKTNAEVINTLYDNHSVNHIVVSKDGQNNKSELIDALTATSIAASKKSPIVLGTNKLTSEQINALEVKSDRSGVYVYQVGHGVARDVIKTIASRINLAK